MLDPNVSKRDIDNRGGPFFIKAQLSDGAFIYSNPIPEIVENGLYLPDGQVRGVITNLMALKTLGRKHHVDINDRDTSLALFKNEAAAIWTDRSYRAYVFSTSTGNVIFTFDMNTKGQSQPIPASRAFISATFGFPWNSMIQ